MWTVLVPHTFHRPDALRALQNDLNCVGWALNSTRSLAFNQDSSHSEVNSSTHMQTHITMPLRKTEAYSLGLMANACGTLEVTPTALHYKVKSFPSHSTHTVVLISDYTTLSQTPADAADPRIQGQCVTRRACLFPASLCCTKLHCLMTDTV